MWLIYALGGGWGHITRAVSLARIHPARILSNSPHAAVVGAGLDVVNMRTQEDVLPAIRDAAPDCLIVDTFPRGLRGELADSLSGIPARKVLIHRDINPRYVATTRLTEFVADHFDLVLVPGPGEGSAFGHLSNAITTAPWLIRSAHELSGVDARYIYVCAAGKPDEAGWYSDVASALRAEGVDVRDEPHWPAVELYSGAVAVVGGGGYNTVHECLAVGVPLIARAWPRKYDRQAERLARAGIAPVNTIAEAVAAALLPWHQPRMKRLAPRYPNGAVEAAAILSNFLSKPS